MPPEPVDQWLQFMALALFCASIATLVALFKQSRQGPLLPFEPRRPVPWGAAGPVLLSLFVLSRVYAVLMGTETGTPEVEDPAEFLWILTLTVVAQFLLFAVFFSAVALMSHAEWSDLGLPRNPDQWMGDVKIGTIAWLAAIGPIYFLQGALKLWSDDPSEHPLITVVLQNPDTLTLAMAFFSAAILAPLGEEITFRVTLQGWLEKLEDATLGWRNVSPPVLEVEGEAAPIDGERAAILAESVLLEPAQPPEVGVYGLRYGWFPILSSSALFAVAHLGHGPDPIPLFVLAMILGYTYQRTHRVVPCIVTHLLVNTTSLVMLWLAITFGNGKVP